MSKTRLTQMTEAAIRAPFLSVAEPEYIRLPKTGQLCQHTGLTRSYLNSLILPTGQNRFKPPVKSICLRQRGAKTGVRLIVYRSLLGFLKKHEQQSEAA